MKAPTDSVSDERLLPGLQIASVLTVYSRGKRGEEALGGLFDKGIYPHFLPLPLPLSAPVTLISCPCPRQAHFHHRALAPTVSWSLKYVRDSLLPSFQFYLNVTLSETTSLTPAHIKQSSTKRLSISLSCFIFLHYTFHCLIYYILIWGVCCLLYPWHPEGSL